VNIHTVYRIFQNFFRRRRMKDFLRTFHPHANTRILDVGGGVYNWTLIGCESLITVLNIRDSPDLGVAPANFTFVKGDGTKLSYPNASFDVAHSNSVIEHLHSYENQRRFAHVTMRVGRGVWVQTPARWFFMEPHLLTPFIHYLPKRWQRRLIRNFTVWGLLTRPPGWKVSDFLDEVRLLTYDDMKRLFPGCEIRRERFLLFTKSYIAVRPVYESDT